MTDLEMTKLCAEAMGWTWIDACTHPDGSWHCGFYTRNGESNYSWAPLHDDAQAMALVKKFKLNIFMKDDGTGDSHALFDVADTRDTVNAVAANLNRAIVECVAKMQANK